MSMHPTTLYPALTRSGQRAEFYRLPTPIDGFDLAGHILVEGEREPNIWKLSGEWRGDGYPHVHDLIDFNPPPHLENSTHENNH